MIRAALLLPFLPFFGGMPLAAAALLSPRILFVVMFDVALFRFMLSTSIEMFVGKLALMSWFGLSMLVLARGWLDPIRLVPARPLL